jgi:hypothetical protein
LPPTPPTPPSAPSPPIVPVPPPPTKRIYCVADAEPTGFHGAAGDGLTSYAINLNCEVATVPPFHDATKQTAQDFFLQFLRAAIGKPKPLRFFLLDTGGAPIKGSDGTGAWTRNPLDGNILSAQPVDSVEPLTKWLDEGASFKSENSADGGTSGDASRAYWLDEIRQADPERPPVTEQEIGATHELRSAHAWNAPMGHRFGLTCIARGLPTPVLPDLHGKGGSFFYVLPYAGNDSIDSLNMAVVDTADGNLDFATPGRGGVTFEASTTSALGGVTSYAARLACFRLKMGSAS